VGGTRLCFRQLHRWATVSQASPAHSGEWQGHLPLLTCIRSILARPTLARPRSMYLHQLCLATKCSLPVQQAPTGNKHPA
jgi:hypothetical protein